MKKFSILSLVVLIGILMVGCGNEAQGRNTTVMNTQTVDDVLEQNTVAQKSKDIIADNVDNTNSIDTGNLISNNEQAVSNIIDNTNVTNAKVLEKSSYTTIDADLTKMSSTLIYSEVYNMMINSADYIDKIVKMKGYTSIYKDETTGNVYYSCIVPDATACCAQGIEFVLNDSYVKYEGYPLDNDEITIVGKFETYFEGGYSYLTLTDAELVKE